jgi:hypothetical protein
VFLFGAGASHGANPAEASCLLPNPPPLMLCLFDRLATEYPEQWGPDSPLWPYRSEFSADFEAAFSARVLRIPTTDDMPRTRLDSLTTLESLRPIALHFAQYRLDHTRRDCYARLISHIRDRSLVQRCLIGSLDYDCLLEQAIRDCDLGFDYWCQDGASDIGLAKLHGSCNFITRMDRRYEAILAGGTMQVHVGWPIEVLPANDALFANLSVEYSHGSVYPALAQIAPDKGLIISCQRLQQARNRWSAAVREAGVAVVIGVAWREHDRHIREPISRNQNRLFYIGGDFGGWQRTNLRFEHLGLKFDEALPALLRQLD